MNYNYNMNFIEFSCNYDMVFFNNLAMSVQSQQKKY